MSCRIIGMEIHIIGCVIRCRMHVMHSQHTSICNCARMNEWARDRIGEKCGGNCNFVFSSVRVWDNYTFPMIHHVNCPQTRIWLTHIISNINSAVKIDPWRFGRGGWGGDGGQEHIFETCKRRLIFITQTDRHPKCSFNCVGLRISRIACAIKRENANACTQQSQYGIQQHSKCLWHTKWRIKYLLFICWQSLSR